MNDFQLTDSTDDADAAALDEARSALAQLLAAAEPTLDEPALVRQICGRLERRKARRRRVRAVLAIAAVLALGVGLACWPRAAREMSVAAAPAEISIDFGWHDDLEQEIASTRWDAWLVEAGARRRFEPVEWFARDLEELEWELDGSPL